MTQAEAILRALQHGDRLTPQDALARFGCFRLAARVWDLRQAGHDIQERMVAVPGRDGPALVAEYSMVPAGELFAVPLEWT